MSERKVMFENMPLDQWPEEDRMGVMVQRMTADRPFVLSVPDERKGAGISLSKRRQATSKRRHFR